LGSRVNLRCNEKLRILNLLLLRVVLFR